MAQRELKESAYVMGTIAILLEKVEAGPFNVIHFKIHTNKLAKGDKKAQNG